MNEPTTQEPPKSFGTMRRAKPPTAKQLARAAERTERAMRRIVKIADRANATFAKRDELIERAISRGDIEFNTPIAINGERYVIIIPHGRWVEFAKFQLKKFPKNPRTQTQPAPTAEASL